MPACRNMAQRYFPVLWSGGWMFNRYMRPQLPLLTLSYLEKQGSSLLFHWLHYTRWLFHHLCHSRRLTLQHALPNSTVNSAPAGSNAWLQLMGSHLQLAFWGGRVLLVHSLQETDLSVPVQEVKLRLTLNSISNRKYQSFSNTVFPLLHKAVSCCLYFIVRTVSCCWSHLLVMSKRPKVKGNRRRCVCGEGWGEGGSKLRSLNHLQTPPLWES